MAKASNLFQSINQEVVRPPIYTPEEIETFRQHPHYLGWLCGKKKLTELHSEWIKHIWLDSEGGEHKSLQAHRGSFKTTSLGVIGPIYYLLFVDLGARIFIIRKDFTAASEIVETIHTIMLSEPIQELFYAVHGIWPKARIKRKEKITYNFKVTVTPEGTLNACGIDGSITGKHGDFFLLDDFVTIKDRLSRADRERTKEVVREILTNVVDPGKPVGMIGTPWHKQDAWTICPSPIKYDVYSTGLLDEAGIAAKRKWTTGTLWAANFLLKHISSEDALFKEPVWGEWKFKGIQTPKAHLDAAFDGEHYCALTIMSRRFDGRVQGVGFVYPGNVKDWVEEVTEICRRFNVKTICMEDNPDKGYTADSFKGTGLTAKSYTETQNKHVKIATYLYEMWSEIIWCKVHTEDEYMSMILDYMEKQEPDDAPDSAAALVRQYFNRLKAARSERYKW